MLSSLDPCMLSTPTKTLTILFLKTKYETSDIHRVNSLSQLQNKFSDFPNLYHFHRPLTHHWDCCHFPEFMTDMNNKLHDMKFGKSEAVLRNCFHNETRFGCPTEGS